MHRLLVSALALAVLVLLPALASAEGPHDMDCMGCHTTHYAKGDYAFGVQPLSPDNPARTRVRPSAAKIDALCLGCHNEKEGIKPIKMHTTHPTGVKPLYTQVPAQLMWEDTFSCVSCHNPHPSNANYMYLIVDTAKGKNMGVFCAKCHPAQSDPGVVTKAASAQITSDPNVGPIVKVTP